ncbi:azurin [Marinoscillum sp.]|uniref:azurin n=1 Tax=Marinoscillum sp. TaxID=2024838 RepID=UPI003BA969F8
MNKFRLAVFSLLVAGLYACGGGSGQSESKTEEPKTSTDPVAEANTVADSISLTIEGNDQMQYNKSELKVTEGQVVTLTLKHVGKMPKESMGHNWVLLTTGTDVAVFGTSAVSAPDNGYIPTDMEDKVIANTKVIGGGEEVTITFDAPKAGYYKYICSFPGHWGVMQGSFVVAPK